MRMKAENRHMISGMAMVLAEIARPSGQNEPTTAANLIAGFGLDLAEFQAAGVDSYDLDVIVDLFRDEYVLRPAKVA